jgi:para-nitrobenzyl esterase
MLREQAVASMLYWATNLEPGAPPVYAYLFERTPPGSPFGSYHTAEVPYVFGTFDKVSTRYLEPDRRLSSLVMSYWTQFARSGDPNGDGLPPWPRLDEATKIMVLGENAGARTALSEDRWEAYRSFRSRGGKLSLF